MPTPDLAHSPLSDAALLGEVTRLAAEGRRATSELVVTLVALDARRLYLAEGYPSLFDFCQRHLHLSESEAYHRIEAARTARRFPVIIDRLRAGALTLTTVSLLRPHLTEANHAEVLEWAAGRTKREVEMFVRTLDPRPDVRTSLRRLPGVKASACAGQTTGAGAPDAESVRTALPDPSGTDAVREIAGPREDRCNSPLSDGPAGCDVGRNAGDPRAAAGPAPREGQAGAVAAAPIRGASLLPGRRPAEIRPLAPARYSLHLTISEETRVKLRRAQALLWHVDPNADEAFVLDRALTLLVETLERRKFAALKLRPPEPPGKDETAPGVSRAGSDVAAQAAVGGDRAHHVSGWPRDDVGRSSEAMIASAGGATYGSESVTAAACATSARAASPAMSLLPRDASAPGPASAAAAERPRRAARRSRTIPAAVRRDVWIRDGGTCAYVGPAGRCRQAAGLEFHHRVPVADGGASTAANLSLRCVLHHAMESETWFGDAAAGPGSFCSGAFRTDPLQLPPEGVGHE